jgi:hypothetical protein
MMHRFLPLAVVSTTLLSSPVLHAELGSVAPVTLALTVTSVTGALPDGGDQDNLPDWERETESATKYTYELKTKFVTTKLTNAVFLNELVSEGVIADVNYTLVMALDGDAVPFGFYLIRKGETTIVTTPVDVTNYLYFQLMAESFLVTTSSKYTAQLNSSGGTTESFNATLGVKGPVEMGSLSFQGCGMYNANLRFDMAREIYVMSSAKITSVAGGYLSAEEDEQSPTVEGSISFGASKPMDVAIFPVQND